VNKKSRKILGLYSLQHLLIQNSTMVLQCRGHYYCLGSKQSRTMGGELDWALEWVHPDVLRWFT